MTGFVLPALAIGLGFLSIRPKRGFSFSSGAVSTLPSQVTIEEVHRDDLEITDHPVEKGSPISDHAFKRPEEVIIKCAWSDSPSGGILGMAMGLIANTGSTGKAIATGFGAVSAISSILSGEGASQAKAVYAQLVALQASAVPFDIQTGKRDYQNMLFRSLSVTTDKETENVLMLTAVCRQVIIAQTQVVQMPVNQDAQANPEKTSSVSNEGTKQLKPKGGA